MAKSPPISEPATIELKAMIERIKSENKALQKLIDNLKEQHISPINPKH
jgi:hypothetical protein